MTLALRYAIRTDVGLLREGNEDSAYAGPHLLAIADGMGGHAAGEVASAVAISTIAGLADGVPDADLLDALARAVVNANRTLHEMSAADPAVEGMGTTLTALLWSGAHVGLCHIGDSRAYLLRDGEFQQITRDHTLVQALVDDGRISPDEATTHPQRSLLLRALDGSADAEPDLVLREARPGDRYLLCSDGLSDVVSEATLHRTLASIDSPDEAVLQFIALALKGGGPDNITCIVADVVEAGTGNARPTEASAIVGAASNGVARQPPGTTSPAGRARVLTQTAPQAAIVVAHDDPAPRPAPAGEADQPGQARRRWPIVTSLVAILLIVVVGAGYASWTYTQSQYYVGASKGKVVIFRGINEDVAGIHLSSVAVRTQIPLALVPTTEQQTIRETIPATGLAGARKTVSTIRQGYQTCQHAYARQDAYDKSYTLYQSKLSAYKKQHGTTKPVTVKKKKYTPPKPPAHVAPIPQECPLKPASVPPATGGTP